MDKKAKEKIRKHAKNIVDICLFLLVSTWFWYGPRETLQKRSEEARISYAYIKGVNLEERKGIKIDAQNRKGQYSFTLTNNTDMEKEVVVRLIPDYSKIKQENRKTLAYNKINYYLTKAEEQDFTLRTLSISGEILITTLQPKEQRKYSFQYFVDNDLEIKNEYFYGKAILSNGENL